MRSPDALTPKANEDTPQGLAYAVSAYVFWGFLPLYMKLVAHIPPVEVVAHRVLWSIPIAGLVLIVLGRTRDLREALRDRRTLAMACVTAALVSVNWGIYVWAIANDRALDAALGYYINPLFSVFIGAVFLRERLSAAQGAAIALAVLAVAVLAYDAGSLPWPAIGLTLSWGFYALAKKQLPVGPNQGFLLEVLILAAPALACIVWLTATGTSHFGTGPSLRDSLLLMGTGVATAVPLMIYANGAKLLRLSTIGILQYIAPTLIFLIAVFVFDEPFGEARMIAFPMIWLALAVYSTSLLRGMRKRAA